MLNRNKRSSYNNRRVAIIGLGRFGSALALTLCEQGVEVLAIDADQRRIDALSDRLTRVATADTTDAEALQQLGVLEYAHVVIAIGSDVEASILTTSIIADAGVPDIWAKALTEQHGKILTRVGAHHVTFPEAEMGRRVANVVTGQLLDFVKIDDNLALVKTIVPRELTGYPLLIETVEERFGVKLVGYQRDGSDYNSFIDGMKLRPEDILVVLGKPEKVRDIAEQD